MSLQEKQLDVTSQRIIEMERNIVILQENITTVAEQLKETQHFLVKLAKNQADITKRVTSWPYVSLPSGDY
jgi:hypothetical protein